MPVIFGGRKNQIYLGKIFNLQLSWAVTNYKKNSVVFGLVGILFTDLFFENEAVLSTFLLCSVPILSGLIF